MSFKSFLLFIFLGTVVSLSAFGWIMQTTNPFEANWVSFFLFYITLFFSVVGVLTLVGIGLRFRFQGVKFRIVKTSFRHAVLLSTVMVIALILAAASAFRWWTFFVLIISSSVIEASILFLEQRRRS